MTRTDRLLVVCVDRDDDLGRKTGIRGPVMGETSVKNAAVSLALADPTESDANCMFAAVKKFREVKKSHPQSQVVAITGHGKHGFQSDKILNQQLDAILKKLGGVDGFVLVTDGAEDDQIIPLLQGRAKLFSKETVIVKQAQVVESTYYTIKEALKDPFLARIFFGIPGLVLLLFVALGSVSLQILAFVFGLYLILKGFGIEDMIIGLVRSITSSITVQRTSFPFYVASLFILGFGLVTGYNSFAATPLADPLVDAVSIARSTYLFIFLAATAIVVAKGIDVVHLKRAHELRKYVLSGVSLILLWFILDSGTLVFLRQADLNLFLFSVLLSFAVMLIAFRITKIMDVKQKITRLLVGLPIYDTTGQWVGNVERIDKKKDVIFFNHVKSKKGIQINRKKFAVISGRVLLSL
jgi:putative membrane protein